jgi:hypothetical protein
MKPHVPLQNIGFTVLSWGMGHWLILSSYASDPTSFPSEMSTQLLLGKRGSVSSGCFLLTVRWSGRGGGGALISGVDPCGLQGTPIELDRGVMHQQR